MITGVADGQDFKPFYMKNSVISVAWDIFVAALE